MSEPGAGEPGDVADAHHLLSDTGSMAVALGALTPREFDCLRLASQGKSHKTIAAELGIVAGTVSSYLRDAKVKLGARSPRHAAMMYASYVYRPPKTGGSNQGIDPVTQVPTSATPVEITEVNDALLDRGTVEPVATTWSKILREILDGGRPGDLSPYTRGMLILLATAVIGFIFFAMTVGLALVAAPVTWVRTYFP